MCNKLLSGLGNLVDTDGEHGDNVNCEEAPACGTVALCDKAGKTEGRDADADDYGCDGDGGTHPTGNGIACLCVGDLDTVVNGLDKACAGLDEGAEQNDLEDDVEPLHVEHLEDNGYRNLCTCCCGKVAAHSKEEEECNGSYSGIVVPVKRSCNYSVMG